MNIKEQIEAALRTCFKKLRFDENTAAVSVSSIDICDYQCNACFALGKQLQKNPLEIAKQIAEKFNTFVLSSSKAGTADKVQNASNQKSTVCALCEAAAPAFLNFKVTDYALSQEAEKILTAKKLTLASQKKRTVFFDYGGANIAKELHVGHLRSPIVGEALKRVFQALGHKTFSDVYLGDWGLQNGLILAELENQKFIKDSEFIKDISLDLLNEVYPLASRKKDTDRDFKVRSDEITLMIQQKKQPWFGLWKQLRETSVKKIRENYNRLNCTFDFYRGESDAQPYVETVLDVLKQKKLAFDSDNCLIMNVAKENESAPMPPIILKKYNGGDLYATNDVATLYYRARDFKPDEFIYLTDARQSLHFEQVFRCVRLGGLVTDGTRLTHIGYGTMNGADGKPFKTRAGGTIKFEEVIDMVTNAAYKKLKANGEMRPSVKEAEKAQTSEITNTATPLQDTAHKTAEVIGLAALKFADLSNNVRKDYVFDIDKFTSFEGKTGPYILYTIARINSIFKKINFTETQSKKGKEVPVTEKTRDILVKILKLADSYTAAAANYTLNGIADAAWAAAAAFNIFYANINIMREQDKKTQDSYLALCELVKIALTQAMHTLAVETVEEM